MDQICLKTVLPLKNQSEHYYGILHIQISLSTKLQLETGTSIFWSKFAHKGYFGSKAKKVSMTIEFSKFKLVKILNFNTFHFWDQVFPKIVFVI